MRIRATQKGKLLTAQISGELDHHTAPEFVAELERLLNNREITMLELDLRGLTFMDSSGIGAILGRYKTINRRKGKVMVRNLRPPIKRVFEMSGLFSVIERAG